MSIAVTVELPEDVATILQNLDDDLALTALKSLAAESYRSKALTAAQIMRLLGFESRFKLDEFLKEHKIYFDYSLEEIEQDARASQRISSNFRKEFQ
jgi:hypothetical protein